MAKGRMKQEREGSRFDLSKVPKNMFGSFFLAKRTKVIRKKNRIESSSGNRKKAPYNARIKSGEGPPVTFTFHNSSERAVKKMDPLTLSFVDPILEEEYLKHFRKRGSVSREERTLEP